MPSIALIGFHLSHSFSKTYFEEKFSQLSLPNWKYELFSSEDLNKIIDQLKIREDIIGFNVTIPHKINVLKYCDKLSEEAAEIGAVNCVKIYRNENKIELTGYNTDAYGFEKSLENWYMPTLNRAIIYGDGGAAKAAQYVLNKLNVEFIQVVRNIKNDQQIHLDKMTNDLFSEYDLIINCTPVGMFPNIDEILNINESWMKPAHHYYDLVYNPLETATMKLFVKHGAVVKNGLEMLHLQADKAWEIWEQ